MEKEFVFENVMEGLTIKAQQETIEGELRWMYYVLINNSFKKAKVSSLKELFKLNEEDSLLQFLFDNSYKEVEDFLSKFKK